MNDVTLPMAYSQLLGAGVLFIGLHCAGMCGPIVVGLDVVGSASGSSLGGGALRLLAYQGGRAVVYALLGLMAGMLGAGLERGLNGAGGILTLCFGAAVLATAVRSRRFNGKAAAAPILIGRKEPRVFTERVTDILRLRLFPLTKRTDLSSRFLLGATLALLPCMIVFWVLGLAASTGSPLHGAGVMVLLVALTTPTLGAASLLARPLRRLPPDIAHALRRVLLGISGVVLLLAGLAALGIIEHAHMSFTASGRHFVVMFW